MIARYDALPAGLLRRDRSPHLGLVFERFPSLIDPQTVKMAEDARSKWLGDFVVLAEETAMRKQRLADVHRRLDAVVADRRGQKRTFTAVERFATGLGNPNAADIGFSFDAACGVPCLAGSAVKGLVREGARLVDAGRTRVAALLGEAPSPMDGLDGTRGKLVFLDALPTAWPALEIDIITRHHDAEGVARQAIPLDADQPNPVPFLTVAPGTAFVFRLLPGSDEVDQGAISEVWNWLTNALDFGAGAKTAVGYGRMVPKAEAS